MKLKNNILDKSKVLNFLSYFEQSNISIFILNSYDSDSKVGQFLSYLKGKLIPIEEEREEKILNILGTYKNQNVFISTPNNKWILDLPKKSSDEGVSMMKVLHWRKLMQKIRNISVTNNLRIILLAVSYDSPNIIYHSNPSIPNIVGGQRIMYESDYVVKYFDSNFTILKNRYGIYNDIINIKEMNFLFREEKLKRILK